MDLQCPHNKKIIVDKTFGIISYLHEDGKPCSILNNYTTRISTIIDNFVRNGKLDLLLSDRKIRAMSTDDNIVSYFMNTLKKCTQHEIILILAYLISIKQFKLINALIHNIGVDLISILALICDVVGYRDRMVFKNDKHSVCLNVHPLFTPKEVEYCLMSIRNVDEVITEIDRRYNNAQKLE